MVSAGINFGGPRRTGVVLAEELQELKRERNAVILAHNYQVPELQDVADFGRDSLGLRFQGAKTGADVTSVSRVAFCGGLRVLLVRLELSGSKNGCRRHFVLWRPFHG